MSQVKITNMSKEDLEGVFEVEKNAFPIPWPISLFEEELNNILSTYLVAKIDEDIVGFAGMKIILDEADIMNVVTKKDKRNLGIGYCLLEKLIYIAKEKCINKLTLEVNEKNFPAIHLYEKLNFEKIAVRSKYYNNIDDAIIMQLLL